MKVYCTYAYAAIVLHLQIETQIHQRKKREEIESWKLPLHTLLSYTQPFGVEVTPQLPGMVGFLFTSR